MSRPPIDDWCDLLAGHEVPDAPEGMKRDAALFREALRRRHEEIAELEIPDSQIEAGLSSLIETAKSLGAFSERGTNEKKRGFLAVIGSALWASMSSRALGAFAVLVLAVGVAFVLAPTGNPPPMEIERGGRPRSGPIEVGDPARAAKDLANDLREIGLRPNVRGDLGFWYVEAAVPLPKDETLLKVLRRHGVEDPNGTKLRAVFAKRP